MSAFHDFRIAKCFVPYCMFIIACLTFVGCGDGSLAQSETESDNQHSEPAVLEALPLSEMMFSIKESNPEESSSEINKEYCSDSSQDNSPVETAQNSEQTEPIVSKPDREELLRKAQERLVAKRQKRTEQKESAKQSSEAALFVSRESVAKDIIDSLVSIPGRSFKLGKTEVTQSQWEGVMGNNPSQFKYPDHPVECVSWDEVNSFLKALNSTQTIISSGLSFRLPTPAEWEYACRAGSTGDFGLLQDGSEGSAEAMARYITNSNNGSWTSPVATMKPNAWGLYDMHGNVAEWTSDNSFDYVVACGGHFGCWQYDCKSFSQDRKSRKAKLPTTGFRLCSSQP